MTNPDTTTTQADAPAAETVDAPAPEAKPADNEVTAMGAALAETDDTDAKSESAGEDKGADAGEEKPSLIGAPETYSFDDVDLGEGVEFDKDAFDALEPVLREMDLSQDAANSLVKGYTEKLLPVMAERAQAQIDEAGNQLRADMAADLNADPDIGGAHLKETQAMAARAFNRFIPDATQREQLMSFLNESGLGNHKELTRFVSEVGKFVSEAQVTADAAATTDTRPPEKKFYDKPA